MRLTDDAAHLSVYPVVPAGVPALPAVAYGTSEARGRTRAVVEGVDRADEDVNRQIEKIEDRKNRGGIERRFHDRTDFSRISRGQNSGESPSSM